MQRPADDNDFQSGHARLLLNSFRRFVGRPLIEGCGSEKDVARQLFFAPFIVVSHNTADDPILNYGNEAALTLWETDWDSLTQMPSRLTAEPLLREKREEIFQVVKEKGFIESYSGVRITSTGRRFLMEDAIVWSLVDDNGERAGEAATFNKVQFL